MYDYAFNETEEESYTPDFIDESIDWLFNLFEEPGKYTVLLIDDNANVLQGFSFVNYVL